MECELEYISMKLFAYMHIYASSAMFQKKKNKKSSKTLTCDAPVNDRRAQSITTLGLYIFIYTYIHTRVMYIIHMNITLNYIYSKYIYYLYNIYIFYNFFSLLKIYKCEIFS